MLETTTTLGALTGVGFVGFVPVSFLYGLFAVVLLVSAHQMLARRGDPVDIGIADTPGNWADTLRLHASYNAEDSEDDWDQYHCISRCVLHQPRWRAAIVRS